MLASIDISDILSWIAQISDDGNEDWPVEEFHPDEWDAETVEISDSASMIDEGPSRARIDRWQAICEATRTGAACR